MAEARSVVVRLSAEASGFIRDMQAAGKVGEDAMRRVDRGGQTASQSVDRLASTAGKMAAGATLALGAMGKAAVDWESQFAGVEKTVDGTAQQMAVLEDELREMARTMPATHQEIAATAEAAGQLGVAREDVAAFTETMVMLGETTNVTAQDAATSIAQISNVMGTAAGDVDNFAATVVDLGNKGASTEGQILDMAARVAGAGALIGASEQDVLALSAAMANLGIQSELGGGAVQRVLVGINTQVASGGDKLQAYADVAGTSAAEFAAAWENDPVRAFDTLIQGLGRIQASGGDVASVLADMGIKGTQNLQVMLRLAGAGDTLTTALDQSGAAWEQNSALTDEYGKRADTTAARIQVAWNQIRDAGIEAGGALLPMIGSLAEGAGKIATAFGQAPEPIQKTVTGLLGITAVTGGAFWFGSKVITGVMETRQAIADLGDTAPRTASALRTLGTTTAIVGGVLALDAAIDQLLASTRDAPPQVQELTGRLLDLTNAKVGDLGSDFSNLGDSLDFFTKNEPSNSWTSFIPNITGLLPGENAIEKMDRLEDTFTSLDSALANIAASGSADQARDAFEALAESENLTYEQQRDLLGQLPQYQEALDGAANSSKLAADGSQDAAAGAAGLGGAAAGAVPAINLMDEALAESRNSAQETAQEFFNLGESLNDSSVSLGDWIAELEAQAAALRDFRVNAEQAADKGLRQGLIAALQEAGPEGALRLAQLADATEGEIRRANRAWAAGQREVNRYTDAVGGIDPAELDVDGKAAQRELRKVKAQLDGYGLTIATARAALQDVASGKIRTVQGLVDKYGITRAEARALLKDQASGDIRVLQQRLAALDRVTAQPAVRVATDPAYSAIQQIRSWLWNIPDETVNVRVNRIGGVTSPYGGRTAPDAGADGMTVPGDRSPYGDKVLMWTAPGEEVVSNRQGQADGFRPELKDINSGMSRAEVWRRMSMRGLADGGTVAGLRVAGPVDGHGGSGGTPGAVAVNASLRLSDHDVQRIAAAVKAGAREGTAAGSDARARRLTASSRTGY